MDPFQGQASTSTSSLGQKPAKAPHKVDASTMAAVPSGSFFAATGGTARVASSIQPKSAPKKKPVEMIRAQYIDVNVDVNDESDDGDLSISTAPSAVPPKPKLPPKHPKASTLANEGDVLKPKAGSKFRPARDPANELWSDEPRSSSPTGARWARAPSTSSAPRSSTMVRSVSGRSQQPSAFSSDDDSSPVRDSAGSNSLRSSAIKRKPEGPAMVVSKIVALEGEDGGIGGIWSTQTWEATFALPDGSAIPLEKRKYLPFGTWIPRESNSPRASKSPEPTPAAKPSAGDTNELPMELDAAGPPTDAMDEDVEVLTPLPAQPAPGYHTITELELAQARPHPNAYFSPRTFSWALLARLPFQDSFSRPRYGRVDNWQYLESDSDVTLEPEMLSPFAPARPGELRGDHRPIMACIADRRQLCSTSGDAVAHTQLDGYPAVIPPNLWDSFLGKDPSPGQSKLESQIAAANLVFRVIDNVLFRGQMRALPITGKTFKKSVTWDDDANDIFVGYLGFTLMGDLLRPPVVDERIPVGLENRMRLLRAWLEVGMFTEEARGRAGSTPPALASPILIKSSREAMLKTLGGDNLPRRPENSGWKTVGGGSNDGGLAPGRSEYHGLGVTPTLADKVIIDMYYDGCEYEPALAPIKLSYLQVISKLRSTEELQTAVSIEKSKGRYTPEDLAAAYTGIGCTGDSPESLTEDVLQSAFSICLGEDNQDDKRRKALIDACTLIAKSRDSQFLEIIINSLVEESKPKMTLQKAYQLFEVDETNDASLLIGIYGVRIMDAPGQTDTMKEALGVIGEHLKSSEIKVFLETGEVGGASGGWEAEPVTSTERPVGLTNIANTCYLNSLLQYFFTVRELRETLLHYAGDIKIQGGEDELPRVGGRLVSKAEVERSRRFAILLQGLFNQLIHAPTTAITPETELAYLALVPSKEEVDATASKNKDDEVTSIAKTPVAMDVSPSAESPASTTSDGAKSPSVLGKRTSEHLDGEPAGNGDDDSDVDKMVIDPELKGPLGEHDLNRKEVTPPPVATSLPRRASSAHGVATGAPSTLPIGENAMLDLSVKEAADGVVEIGSPDVEMAAPGPPPLPPRLPKGKEPEKMELEKQVSSYMAFGKQNDVTECMDNVMFQLECALNPTSSDSDGGEAASLIKRTFYGKMQQRLDFINDPLADAAPEPPRTKEEPFLSLFVDVADKGRNLYDGLDVVFDDALVDFEGKRARRRITLIDVPPLLQIQLSRVQYDRVAQKIFKSNVHMSFGETITMDRYLEIDPADEAAVVRRDRTAACRMEMDVARARLQSLTKVKDTDMSKVLRSTRKHLIGERVAVLDTLKAAIDEDTLIEAADLETEINTLRLRVRELRNEIEAIWIDEQSATFELVSVFIHRGNASGGHYYIYQRDSQKPESWLKYNDSLVTIINPKEEVFREFTGDTNPYFLVYCRRDRLDAIDSCARSTAAAWAT